MFPGLFTVLEMNKSCKIIRLLMNISLQSKYQDLQYDDNGNSKRFHWYNMRQNLLSRLKSFCLYKWRRRSTPYTVSCPVLAFQFPRAYYAYCHSVTSIGSACKNLSPTDEGAHQTALAQGTRKYTERMHRGTIGRCVKSKFSCQVSTVNLRITCLFYVFLLVLSDSSISSYLLEGISFFQGMFSQAMHEFLYHLMCPNHASTQRKIFDGSTLFRR